VAVHDTLYASSGKQAFIRSIQSQDKDMAWHVGYFKAFPTEHGYSSLVEEVKPVECGEALLLFISFEKSDVEKRVEIIDKAQKA